MRHSFINRKVDDEKLLKGKSVEAIKAACIYIACREHNSTRTFKEICNLTRVSKKEIGRCFKQLLPNLAEHTFAATQAVTLDAYVYRFCSQMQLSNEVVRNGLKVSFIVD